jgi:hypothetical protein
MLVRSMIVAAALTSTVSQAGASASQSYWRCDCTKPSEVCVAEVKYKDGWLTVRSSSDACSLVTIEINRQPHVVTAVDGEASEQWLGDRIRSLRAVSCSVCRERPKP